MDKKIQQFFTDKSSGERIYLIAFMIYLIGETLTTTMFPVPGVIFQFCKLSAVALVIFKVLFFDTYVMRNIILLFLLMLDVILIAISSGYSEPLLWIVLVIGAKNVSLKKILQVYLVIAFTIIVLAFAASLLNVIVNLQYESDEMRGVRNSFGIVYTTDFAAHIFMLILTAFYLLKERLSVIHYLLTIVLAVLIYIFCNTRLDVACMIVMVIAFMILGRNKSGMKLRSKYQKKKLLPTILMWSMPIAALLMLAFTFLYTEQNASFVAVDELLSNRLSLGQSGLQKYGVTVFGQVVDMVGYGGTTELAKDYFFVDCSYIYILLKYGLIFFFVVIVVFMKCCKKYRNDIFFLIVIALVSLNCMIAHHLIELAYNPFALALFAAVPDTVVSEKFMSERQYSKVGVKYGGNESKISKI